MTSLKEYAERMNEYKSFPSQLSHLLISMASDYGSASNNKIRYEIERADFWLERKKLEEEKPVSDKTLEMLWIRDGKGKEERTNEIYMKGLAALMSALKSALRTLEIEARNLT